MHACHGFVLHPVHERHTTMRARNDLLQTAKEPIAMRQTELERAAVGNCLTASVYEKAPAYI